MRLLFIFFLLPSLLQAQEFVDIAEVDYRISPQTPLESNPEDKVDIENLHARLLYPMVLDSSSTLLTSLIYDRLEMSPYTLHSIFAIIGVDQLVGSDSKLLALAIPKLSSDMKDFSKRDFQLGVLAILTKPVSENYSWKFGATANSDLFGPLLTPVIGFKWQADPSLRIEASLPFEAHMRKTLNPRFITGIKYRGRKFSYNLSKEESYMEVADNHVWAYADIYMTSSWVLQVRAGHSILRSYAPYPNDETVDISFGPLNLGDDRPEPIYERKNGASFQVGLRYRYALDD